MTDDRPNGSNSILVWIYIGSALFLVALLVSAIVVPGLRFLHSFQALIYVAVIVLARRNSAWGYGAGFSIAVVWNAMGLFLTHLIERGAAAFVASLRTGHVQDLVPMMVTLGGIGHFILIAAALTAIIRSTEKKSWWKFAGGGVLAVAYLALIVSFSHPR